MAGLLSSTSLTPPQAGQMPAGGTTTTADRLSRPTAGDPSRSDAPADDEADVEGETPNVTPEEQAAYEKFVNDGFKLIYENGEVRPSILEMLDEDTADLTEVLGDVKDLTDATPAVRLAATTVIVVIELLRRAGNERPDDTIIFHGGKALLEDIANLATEAKVHDYSQEEINQAFLMGMDLYRETANSEGLINLDAAKEEFNELVTADKEGRLGELLPQLANAPAATEQPMEESRGGTA